MDGSPRIITLGTAFSAVIHGGTEIRQWTTQQSKFIFILFTINSLHMVDESPKTNMVKTRKKYSLEKKAKSKQWQTF